MPSDDEDRLTAFPLHNNEPELIDYFVSPLGGISESISPTGVVERYGRTSQPLAKADAVRHQHTVSLFHSVICRETVSKFAPTRTIFLSEY